MQKWPRRLARTTARKIETLLMVAIAAAGVACDGAPSEPGGGDNVQIDLAPYFSSFGAGRKTPCTEADLVTLEVQELDSGRVQTFSDSVPACTAMFTVTVKGGRTEFTTLVTGDERPLLADITTLDIQTDGWRLPVGLQPIPALLVTVDTSTDTTGVAATLSYTYTVTTEESGTSDPFPIAADSNDVQFALSAGDAIVQLFGSGACGVGPDSIQTADIPTDADSLGAVTFGVDCNSSVPMPPTGTVRIITITTGMGGPVQYVLVVAPNDTTVIGRNDTVVVTGVPVGDQLVELLNAVGCSITPSNPQTAMVTANGTTDIVFTVDATFPCGSGQFGSIEVITATTGGGGPVGYDFTIDGGASMPIGTIDTVLVDSVAIGTRAVELLNFTPCAVSPDSVQQASVVANSTVQVTFTIDCTTSGPGSGAIGVITNTTGPDPGSFEYQMPPDTAGIISANDTVIVDGLAPGPRQVFLGNTSPCLVTSANPDTVTVVAGDTVFVTFDVECSPQIQVQTTTVGTSFDPDGYAVTVVDSAQTQPIGIDDSVVFGNISPGSHTVQLSGVASNCIVVTGATRTAVVGTIGTTTVQYVIECFVQSSQAPDGSGDAPAPEASADPAWRHAMPFRGSS